MSQVYEIERQVGRKCIGHRGTDTAKFRSRKRRRGMFIESQLHVCGTFHAFCASIHRVDQVTAHSEREREFFFFVGCETFRQTFFFFSPRHVFCELSLG